MTHGNTLHIAGGFVVELIACVLVCRLVGVTPEISKRFSLADVALALVAINARLVPMTTHGQYRVVLPVPEPLIS